MMRGDIKWPPEGTRQQMLNEEEEQKKIAEGPKFRPKKVHKVSALYLLILLFYLISKIK